MTLKTRIAEVRALDEKLERSITMADSLMAVFGLHRVAIQRGNVIYPEALKLTDIGE